MSLVKTTLSAAAGAGDTKFTVASATSLAAGQVGRVDDEQVVITAAYVVGSTSVSVVRAQAGTTAAAHPASANIEFGAASDTAWGAVGAAVVVPYPLAGRTRRMASYSASGAITLPDPGTDQVAVLNGTGALAMTLADPTSNMDGTILIVTGNGAAAHTLTIAGGIGDGGGSYDVLTWAAGAKSGIALIACNEAWNPLTGVLAGNTTNITLTIA